jgi:3-deoxy-manno-octulosonate cytidylyltransferase (CMP-KDO synthetase)
VTFHVVIPSRYASTRLPGKPLLDIGGRPMIQRVVECAAASGAASVLVATDDLRIASAVVDPRGQDEPIAVMTDPGLPSGTDRVAVVVRARGWEAADVVVNVQGDEPFVPPALIDQVAALLEGDPRGDIATLVTPVASLEEFMDPNVVKVVVADDGAALYFSRAPIPWPRDGAPAGITSQTMYRGAWRHVGLYAYRVGALQRITSLPPSSLEQCEKLEQLRALQAGLRIVVAPCAVPPGPGVDTAHDLELARARASRETATGANGT